MISDRSFYFAIIIFIIFVPDLYGIIDIFGPQGRPAGFDVMLNVSMFDAAGISDAIAGVREIYGTAVEFRRTAHFGEAINAFREAAAQADRLIGDIEKEVCIHKLSACSGVSGGFDAGEQALPDEILDMKNALLEIRSRALASVELIQEINGFVNVDLMNP